jgi:hypothetical protein
MNPAKPDNPVLSAQVIVRSRSGKQIRGDTPITTRNLADYAPSAEDANFARTAFARAGFQTGNLVGISFSITAPAAMFESFFGAAINSDAKGRIKVAGAADPEGLEIPLGRLPEELAQRIVAVTFSPPADLHDGGAMR